MFIRLAIRCIYGIIPDMSNGTLHIADQLFGKNAGTRGTPGTVENMVIPNVYNTLVVASPFARAVSCNNL